MMYRTYWPEPPPIGWRLVLLRVGLGLAILGWVCIVVVAAIVVGVNLAAALRSLL